MVVAEKKEKQKQNQKESQGIRSVQSLKGTGRW